jgi:hypothetical protein
MWRTSEEEMVVYTFTADDDDEQQLRATPLQRLVRALWGYWESARTDEYRLVRGSSVI